MIYFIQNGENGAIKIGYTSNKHTVGQRLRTMQTGNPSKLILLKLIEGNLNDESVLHQMFKKLRITNEWFEPDDSLLAFIKKPNIKTSSNHFKCECKFCNYTWVPKKHKPKECPACKRYNYDKPDKPKKSEVTK